MDYVSDKMKNLFAYTQEQIFNKYYPINIYIYTTITNLLSDNHLSIHLYLNFYLQNPHRFMTFNGNGILPNL